MSSSSVIRGAGPETDIARRSDGPGHGHRDAPDPDLLLALVHGVPALAHLPQLGEELLGRR